jgi:hypothetical protein
VLVAECENLMVEEGLVEGGSGLVVERLREVDPPDLCTDDWRDRLNFQ